MAVCDRDGVFGAPRFYHAANDAGVRPLVGSEITLRDGTVLPLLVANRTGYQNLCQLISTAKQEPRSAINSTTVGHKARPITNRSNPNCGSGFTPDSKGSGRRQSEMERSGMHFSRLEALAPTPADLRERKRPCYATWDEVAQYSEGLIAITGDAEGPLLSVWQNGGAEAIAEPLQNLKRIFGSDRLFVEVQHHRVRGEERTVRFLRDLTADQNLPLLATGGVTHANRESRLIADVFTCLRHHTSLDGAGRLLSPNAE